MKKLFKYIFLLVTLCFIFSPIEAKKKSKKSTKKSIVKGKSSKKKRNSKSSKNKKTVNLNKTNLKDLLNETTVTVAPSKIDSVPDKVITILSAFKPQLKNVAKISFSNAIASVDTVDINLNYQVPSQNLSFEYRPISLIPRSFLIDSNFEKTKNINTTIGFGNYAQFKVKLNAIFKDKWNNSHSFSILNQSAKGTNHYLQLIKNWEFQYLGDLKIHKNTSIQSLVFYSSNQRYRYGLVPDSIQYPLSNFSQKYDHTGLQLSLINSNNTQKLFIYNPILKIEYFKGINDVSNNWFEFNNPMYLVLKNKLKFNFDLNYSYNQYNLSSTNHQKNTLLKLDPSISIEKWGTLIKAGASPVLINKNNYQFNPNVYLQKKLADTIYTIKSGWNTIFFNNQYTTLAIQNPWIDPVDNMLVTSNEKKYIHLEVNTNKKLYYTIGLSINEYKNLLFFNQIIDKDAINSGLKYKAIFERRAATLELDASLRYQFSDKFLLTNSLHYKQFNIIRENAKPWGILPLEINSSLNWNPNNKWNLETSFSYWTGAAQFEANNRTFNLKNVLVINAGFNYKLSSTWSAWAKGENLLDKPYERWASYPSLGAQITAGIIYSFRK